MNKKEKAVIQELLVACCHITRSRGYKRITECLVDLDSKPGSPAAMAGLTGTFEDAMDAAAKLIGLRITSTAAPSHQPRHPKRPQPMTPRTQR